MNPLKLHHPYPPTPPHPKKKKEEEEKMKKKKKKRGGSRGRGVGKQLLHEGKLYSYQLDPY